MVKAHEFFEKYGPKSLVLARFVPIVRTFTPIIAGVSGMKYRSFLTFNIIGGVLWGAGVTLLGSWLGKIDFVKNNIEAILILIVLVSVVPIAIEFLRARSKAKRNPPEPQTPQGPAAYQQQPMPPAMDDATRPLRMHQPQQGHDPVPAGPVPAGPVPAGPAPAGPVRPGIPAAAAPAAVRQPGPGLLPGPGPGVRPELRSELRPGTTTRTTTRARPTRPGRATRSSSLTATRTRATSNTRTATERP